MRNNYKFTLIILALYFNYVECMLNHNESLPIKESAISEIHNTTKSIPIPDRLMTDNELYVLLLSKGCITKDCKILKDVCEVPEFSTDPTHK